MTGAEFVDRGDFTYLTRLVQWMKDAKVRRFRLDEIEIELESQIVGWSLQTPEPPMEVR